MQMDGVGGLLRLDWNPVSTFIVGFWRASQDAF
jgi:hypothetical protein